MRTPPPALTICTGRRCWNNGAGALLAAAKAASKLPVHSLGCSGVCPPDAVLVCEGPACPGPTMLLPASDGDEAASSAATAIRRCAAPSMSLAAPVAHTAGQFAATAIGSGVLALCAQAALVAAFRRAPKDSILRRSAGYIAHHLIALAFMVVATVVGFAGWFSPAAATSALW